MNDLKTIKNILIFFAIILAFYLMKILSSMIIPLFLALFIAFLFYPFINWLVNKKIPYFLSVTFVIGIFGTVIYLIGQKFIVTLQDFYANRDIFVAQFSQKFSPLLEKIDGIIDPELLSSANLIDYLLKNPIISDTIMGFSGSFFMTLIYLIFILAGNVLKYDEYIDYLENDVNGEHHAVNLAFTNVRLSITKYMGIKTTLSLVTGFLFWITCLVFKVEYAFMWGILAFILNFIPYFGSIIASFFPLFMGFIQIKTTGGIASYFIILLGIQLAIGNFIDPYLTGKRFSINTVVILFALVLFTYIWGAVGTILSVPLLVFAKVVLEHVPEGGFWVRLLSKNSN